MKQTSLNALHRELGAKIVPFAGYDMPVQYPAGIIQEHNHTRSAAGLFDVSHMGQLVVSGDDATKALEAVLPADLENLAEHEQVYSLLTNDQGGVRDDLIVTRWGDNEFFLVINAACKDADIAYLEKALPGLNLQLMEDRGLLALQGPAAREVLTEIIPSVATLTFMSGMRAELEGEAVYITCSGYTGEDGFELSLPASITEKVARQLLSHASVEPIGLGARDSLRLEAGLCLYGHELNEETTPVAAGLMWSIGAERRSSGTRAGGFPGAEIIFEQQQTGPAMRRVGLLVEGKRPVREGQQVINDRGEPVGIVTSGAFSPTLNGPVAMAYVPAALSQPGQALTVDVRGKAVDVSVQKMPFVPQRYFRG